MHGQKNAFPINPYSYPSAVVWALLWGWYVFGNNSFIGIQQLAGYWTRQSARKYSQLLYSCTLHHHFFVRMPRYAKVAVVPSNFWNGACVVMATPAVEWDEISEAELIGVDEEIRCHSRQRSQLKSQKPLCCLCYVRQASVPFQIHCNTRCLLHRP